MMEGSASDIEREIMGREEAAEAVCRAMANRRDDAGWTMVNTFGHDDFPPEVKAWESRVGPHVFYPMCVLACHALARPVPSKEEE